MPVTAEVLELNEALDEHPELVNQHPYTEGWIVKVAIKSVGEADSLLSASDYQQFIGE